MKNLMFDEKMKYILLSGPYKVLFFLGVVAAPLFLSQSCVRHNKLTTFNSASDHEVYVLDSVLEYKIIKGDKIGVQVINNTGEEIDVFNKQMTESAGDKAQGQQMQGYDVDVNGNIDLPMIGKVQVVGKTIYEVDSLIENKLTDYIAYAYVKTTLLSYRITMLGEVRAPQTINNMSDNINIAQALGMAGDFTDYADKRRVKIYRKTSSQTYEMYVLNLLGDNIFTQSQFQLMPNDIVYVEPLKAKTIKVNAPTVSLALSIVTLTFVILNFVKL